MPKPKASSSKAKGQMPLTYYLTPTSTSKAPANRKRKRPPATASQDGSIIEELPAKKGKIKENVSPVTSPDTTPTRKRHKLKALGSETNVLSGVETFAQGESSKIPVDADREEQTTDISEPPAPSPAPSPASRHIGLPTPVTVPRRRTGPAKESTSTPAQRVARQPPASMSTPHVPALPSVTLQQPTPDTTIRPARTMKFITSSPVTVSSGSPPLSRKSSAQQQKFNAGSFEVVVSSQGSQELEINPFIDNLTWGPTKAEMGLFKLPSLPARLQEPSSVSSNTHGTPSSPIRRSKPLGSPSSSLRRIPSKYEIVPSSQGDEDELAFWSPRKDPHIPEGQAPADFVPSSMSEEEELFLPDDSDLARRIFIASPSRRTAPSQELIPRFELPELSGPRSPSTPKRKTAVSCTPTKSALLSTPHRTPAADSGLGASVSPEKDGFCSSQTVPESPRSLPPPLDESQTQPETPYSVRTATHRTPCSPASSLTVPESPRSPLKTPGKPCLYEADDSQTQPESPHSRIATASKNLSHGDYVMEEDIPGSHVLQESPPSPVKSGGHEECAMEEDADSSQTVPESPRWRVPAPITPPSKKTRGYLPDDENLFTPIPSSLPCAESDGSQPKAEASTQPGLGLFDVYKDGSQTQPDAWPLTPRNKRMMRRLQHIRNRHVAEASEKNWDMLSDAPLSIPSDFGEDAPMSQVGSDLPSPARDFLGMDM